LALFNLGLLAWGRGEDDRARAFFEDGLSLAREVQSRFIIPLLLHNLGLLAWRRGDYHEAQVLEREALTLRQDLGDKRGIAHCLEGLAWLASARRKPTRAARLFGAAEVLRERSGMRLYPFRQEDHDRSVAMAQHQLGSERFAAARDEGRIRALEETIADALADDESIEASVLDCPLSPRELEVAGLIAQGLTNQAIAERLLIGRRTAETHAAAILGKLGFSARPQIAAWFVAHGSSSTRHSV
jgi:non-specific serine/threonine protein kinase